MVSNMITTWTVSVVLTTSLTLKCHVHAQEEQQSPRPRESSECSQDTTWIILFVIALVAFIISVIAHIIVYYRRRKFKQTATDPDPDGDYVISNFPVKQPKVTGNQPTDDYEKPLQSATLQVTPTVTEAASSEVSRAATMPALSSSDQYKEITVIGPSVTDRKSMFEDGTTANNSESDYEIKMNSESNEAHLRHASGSSNVDGELRESVYEIDSPKLRNVHGDASHEDSASVASLGMPDDIAPTAYERVRYKKTKCNIM